jgi:hypothetical protein
MHMKSRVVEDAERGGEIKVWSKLNGRPCPGANVLVAARYERRLLVFLLIARERERERGRGEGGEGGRVTAGDTLTGTTPLPSRAVR